MWEEDGRGGGGGGGGENCVHSNCTLNKVSCQAPSLATFSRHLRSRRYFPTLLHQVMGCKCLSGLGAELLASVSFINCQKMCLRKNYKCASGLIECSKTKYLHSGGHFNAKSAISKLSRSEIAIQWHFSDKSLYPDTSTTTSRAHKNLLAMFRRFCQMWAFSAFQFLVAIFRLWAILVDLKRRYLNRCVQGFRIFHTSYLNCVSWTINCDCQFVCAF